MCGCQHRYDYPRIRVEKEVNKLIRVTALNKGLEVKQTAQSPLVYLDIWSYDFFVGNRKYGETFIDALRNTGGTLCISLMIITELSKRTDKNQIYQICNFIDYCDTFVIDMNLSRVIRKEQTNQNSDYSIVISDEGVLTILGTFCYQPLTAKFSITSLIKKISDELKRPVKTDFSGSLNPIIRTARDNDKFLEAAKRRRKRRIQRTGPPYTEVIAERCFDFITANKTMKMPESEWADVFHLIVPVSYCNFVLLDNRWVSFVNSLELKSPDIANVYNKGQINKFLDDLVRYNRII